MPLAEGLLTPIPGENPCGPNLYYSPEFDKIRKAREPERDENGQLIADLTTVDYREVVRLITATLSTKTKDLNLAAWLGEALLATTGFGGLQENIELIRALLERFWDNIHPAIEDGDAEMRATPLEWFGNYLDPAKKWSPAFIAQLVPLTASGLNWLQYSEGRRIGYEEEVAGSEPRKKARAAAVKEGKLAPEQFDAAVLETPKAFYKKLVADLTASAASLDALDQFCQERFGSAAPSFIKLRRVLAEITVPVRAILKQKLELEPDPPEPSEPEGLSPAFAVGAGGAAAAPALAPGVLTAEIASREDAVQHVIAAARRLRQDNPADPVAYVVVRALRWGEMRAGGGAIDQRMLDAPSPEIRTRVRRLAMDGLWTDLLAYVEDATALPCGRGWLDLQRYAVRACEHLGDEFAPVASAIRGALRDYLAAFPELPHLMLMDDTPAANAETQQWISEQVAPGPGLRQILSAAPSPAENGTGEIYNQALEAAQAGRHGDALALLARFAPENSGRARFLHRLQLAQVLMAAGRAKVAHPVLTELAQEIEARKLEQWESPALVARVLALQFHCLKELKLDSDTRDKIQQKLCLLDPVQALGCAE
ncbi:MAG TPA: type VI secretion system protein TssA [Bryobacteraceae bacterium]|nr:type VI secretion system protein TssA [Bryobacteraceae bacterium]